MDNLLNQEDIEKIKNSWTKIPLSKEPEGDVDDLIKATEKALLSKLQVDDKELVEMVLTESEIIRELDKAYDVITNEQRETWDEFKEDRYYQLAIAKAQITKLTPYLSQRIKDAKKEERERIYNDWINNGNLPTLKEI